MHFSHVLALLGSFVQLSPARPLELLCAGLHGYPVEAQLMVSCLLCAVPASLVAAPSVPSVPSAAADASRQMSAPSQTGSGRRRRRQRRWAGLRQKWKLLGLFEIDQQHEFYTLTRLMKEGLATASQDPPEENQPVSTRSDSSRRSHWLVIFSGVETAGAGC